MDKLIVRNLGRQPYASVWAAMKALTSARDASSADELWLVEHDPVFTQGLAGRPEHLLNPGNIPVVQTDRGGQVTYHGPGQVVAYPLLDLPRRKTGVRQLVKGLEQAVINQLAGLGVAAGRKEKAPGVFVDGAKIASIGLKVRRGCTYHGLAFNIDMDLTPFSFINPCGFAGLHMTQVADCVDGPGVISWQNMAEGLAASFGQTMGYHICRGSSSMPGIDKTSAA